MNNGPPNTDPARVRNLIDELPDEHVLKRSPATYVDGFVAAALDVYDPGKLYKVLKKKFFIPSASPASQYTDERYLQSASELTVAHHIKKRRVGDFQIEKRVSAENRKDVDVFFRAKSTNVAIEVKCPFEEEPAPYPGTITLNRAGRTAGTDETYEQIRQTLQSTIPGTNFDRGRNRDHRMKDCLISAHQKFSSESGLNILFLSCGHFHRIGEWYGCLFGRHELFTAESFQAPKTYSKVDVVILSNVKYRHQHARDYPAWTLDDVLLLPVVNPYSRRRLLTHAVNEGLGVFDHYLKDIARPQIISAMYHPVDPAVDAITQVNYFVQERLTSDERARFFPVSLNS
jgi:hypothetical protein